MAQRYLLAGARGGQGTTTLATVLAVLSAVHRPTVLATAQVDDVCALTGIPRPELPSTAAICPNLMLVATDQLSGEHRDGPGRGGEDIATAPVPVGGRDVSGPGCTQPEVSVVDLGRLAHVSEPESPVAEPGVVRWLVVRGPCYLSLRAAVGHRWQPDGVILVAEPGRSLSAADVSDVVGAPIVAKVPVEPAVARVIDAGLLLGRLHRLSAFRSLAELVRAPDVPQPTTPARAAL